MSLLLHCYVTKSRWVNPDLKRSLKPAILLYKLVREYKVRSGPTTHH